MKLPKTNRNFLEICPEKSIFYVKLPEKVEENRNLLTRTHDLHPRFQTSLTPLVMFTVESLRDQPFVLDPISNSVFNSVTAHIGPTLAAALISSLEKDGW